MDKQEEQQEMILKTESKKIESKKIESKKIESKKTESDIQDEIQIREWMYLPVFPPKIDQHFETLADGSAPSRNQDFDRYTQDEMQKALFIYKRARYFAQLLDQHRGEWEATLEMKPWVETPLSKNAPPYRYEVHVKIGLRKNHELFLTPADLRAITRLNVEVGRAIGDELDGPRPK